MSEQNPLKATPEVKPEVKQPGVTPNPLTAPTVNKPAVNTPSAAAPAPIKQPTGELAKRANEPATIEFVSRVNTEILEMAEIGGIDVPRDYSLANALKAAYLAIQEVKGKNDVPALQCCTRESITKALFKMAVQGLTVMKEQGDFIVHADQLVWRPRVVGRVALAKRYGGLKNVVANVIYHDDLFEFEIDLMTGRKKLTKHTQSLKTINTTGADGIKGAYAIVEMNDGTFNLEVMNITQIRAAWSMGTSDSASKKFPEEHAKKTVIGRAIKELLRTSNDAILLGAVNDNEEIPVAAPKKLSNAELSEKVTNINIEANKPEEPTNPLKG